MRSVIKGLHCAIKLAVRFQEKRMGPDKIENLFKKLRVQLIHLLSFLSIFLKIQRKNTRMKKYKNEANDIRTICKMRKCKKKKKKKKKKTLRKS